jgi:hypothetical protein
MPPARRHEAELAGVDHDVAAEAVAVVHLAVEDPAHGLQPMCGCGGTCMPGLAMISSGP